MVTEREFDPPMVKLKRGLEAHLTFIRTAEAGCLEPVQVPAQDMNTGPLPLNQPVMLSFKPDTEGVFTFVCGMDHFKGRIVVKR